MDRHVFDKYLRRNQIPRVCGAGCSRAAVIPVFNELAELPRTLDSLSRALEFAPRPVAVIAVVNFPAGAEAAESLATLELLSKRTDIPVLETLYAPDLSGGVGAARKLGMDAFVASQSHESLDDALIYSLDADTRVSESYFSTLEADFAAHPEAGFVTANFRHETGATPELEKAIRNYETYLRNYASGLRRARSPYAFTSIGSAFAVRGATYVRSGGMKARKAGEDFYFLQQCAKCGGFFEEEEVLVFPSARLSGRNPFGTGPALEGILAGEFPRRTPDAAFELLAKLLEIAEAAALADPARLLAVVPPEARNFLEAEKFPEVWKKVLANTPDAPGSRRRAFDCWFDGLKTLRFLHCVSEDFFRRGTRSSG